MLEHIYNILKKTVGWEQLLFDSETNEMYLKGENIAFSTQSDNSVVVKMGEHKIQRYKGDVKELLVKIDRFLDGYYSYA